MEACSFDELLGKTLEKISVADDNTSIDFVCSNGDAYSMFHSPQECCEEVAIEDICGDLGDLIGSPLVLAEETTSAGVANSEPPLPEGWGDGWGDSYTWTFYRMGTAKGTVTIRWFGSSNGYYSESVDFFKK
jgi:hypothetical protein